MKKIYLLLMCLSTLALSAQEEKEADSFTKATFTTIFETHDEGVMVKARCIIFVTNEYIVMPEQTLKGFYDKGEFVFRVGLDYYSVNPYFVWDVKSRTPFITIDELKSKHGDEATPENDEVKKNKKDNKKKRTSDAIYE